MTSPTQNGFDRTAGAIDAERSLRLLASLPAPTGIEDRVKSGLRSASPQTSAIPWPHSSSGAARWAQSPYMRGAAAAAIVLAVVGGGWGVHSRFQPAPVPAAQVVPQRLDGVSGGISTAGARRTPKTVEVPVIAAPAPQKPGIIDGRADANLRANRLRNHAKKVKPSPSVAAPAVR
jgi:hypothetical protein